MLLEKISRLIVNSRTVEEEYIAAKLLLNFYDTIEKELSISDYDVTGTSIKGGIALSPLYAKECLDDSIRTIRFIKGIYKALQELKIKFKKERLKILYAGCGPLGTLIIPLLSLSESEKLGITFLDIHEKSVSSLKSIINYLGFQDFVINYCVNDATLYGKEGEDKVHMVVTETMDKGLTKEPQVMITKNLISMLEEGGVLIPEEIKLTVGYSFLVNEKKYNGKKIISHQVSCADNKRNRELFTITKNTAFTEGDFIFESEIVPIGVIDKEKPDVCIFTQVKIFDNEVLKSGESYITNPFSVWSLMAYKAKSYKLIYTTKEIPEWKVLTES